MCPEPLIQPPPPIKIFFYLSQVTIGILVLSPAVCAIMCLLVISWPIFYDLSSDLFVVPSRMKVTKSFLERLLMPPKSPNETEVLGWWQGQWGQKQHRMFKVCSRGGANSRSVGIFSLFCKTHTPTKGTWRKHIPVEITTKENGSLGLLGAI